MMADNEKKELSEEDIDAKEAELLAALAAQAPAEDYIVSAGTALAEGTALASKEDIVEALRTVSDPEIMINIYDMGFIYDIRRLLNGNVEIDMTLTAPTCPVAGILPQQAADAVAAVDGVGIATVKVVWEPAWTPDRLTEEARAILELF